MSSEVELNDVNSSKRSTSNQQELSGTYNKTCPLYHDSTVRHIWDITIAVNLMYIALLMPFLFAFYEEQPSAFETIDLAMDIFFICDVFLNFSTTYAEEDGRVVSDYRKIASNYIAFWFWIDFVSSVPLSRIFESKAASIGKAVKVLRVFKFAKMLRMSKLAKMIPQLQNKYEIKNSSLAVFRFSSLIIITAHWLACFFFLIGRGDAEANWIIKYRGSDYIWDAEGMAGSNYLMALYWAFTTMTTIGYGDITPANDGERAFMLFAMCLGAGIFAYGLTNMCTLVFNFNQKEVLFTALQDGIKSYLDNSNCNVAITRKIRQFIFYRYTRSFVALFSEHSLLEELSPSLHNAVLIDFYQHIALKVPIVGGILFSEGHGDFFVSNIVRHLKGNAFPDGELIIKANQQSDVMYYVAQGKVQVQIDASIFRDQEGDIKKLYNGVPKVFQVPRPNSFKLHENPPSEVPSLREALDTLFLTELDDNPNLHRFLVTGGSGDFGSGGSFGEIACMLEWRSTLTAFARTYCDVFTLERAAVQEVLQLFPELDSVEDCVSLNLRQRWRDQRKDFSFGIDAKTAEERQQIIELIASNSYPTKDEEPLAIDEAQGPRVFRSKSLEQVALQFSVSEIQDAAPNAVGGDDGGDDAKSNSDTQELDSKVDKLAKDMAKMVALFEDLSKL